MGRINSGRVILGGLLAGFVLNIGEFILNELVLKSQWEAAMAALNLPTPGGATIAWFVILGFVVGILSVWLYAAIRPRLGAGAKTAVVAGLFVWALGWFYSMIFPMLTGVLPSSVVWIAVIWGLVEVPVATVIGAAPYKE